MAVEPDWLAQTDEEALLPALPIIDPHHHLWDRPGSRYMNEELSADTDSHNVRATVFVECMSGYRTDGPDALRPVGETEFVEAAIEFYTGTMGFCAGIVGFADLTLAEGVDSVLDAHLDASPSRFRGIRHAVGWDASEAVRNSHTAPPKGLLSDANYRKGAKRLAARDLSFDAWLYHPQLGELLDFARALPELPIILDHFGGPLGIGPYEGRRAEVYELWKAEISALAKCPNVSVKLGGLAMPINGFSWHKRKVPPGSLDLASANRDYYLHTIDCFGTERCMFESNFPVDKQSCSYKVLWNAFKRIADGFSEVELRHLFYDTAKRIYRLDLP